jgi:hypothetical protein
MCDVAALAGMAQLWDRTRGDERICVAVLDGPIDLDHPAFVGARIARFGRPRPTEEHVGVNTRHGTHVASVVFGQHDGPVPGVAPDCGGLSVPVFSDRRAKMSKTSQLDMARGIERAVEAGAHVINISAGQFTASGEAEDLLERAVRLCAERNVLVVAAAGNDGCFCDHVPAALASVLAVGALNDAGQPLPMSNWGRTYQDHGILAPGENVLGAVPGGTTARATGTSLATPIVSGVAALLLSIQLQAGRSPDPMGIRAALLSGADPCELADEVACRRFLTGALNIRRAMDIVQNDAGQATDTVNAVSAMNIVDGVVPVCCGCGGQSSSVPPEEVRPEPAPRSDGLVGVAPSAPLGPRWDPYVYALGTLGYDFGSEARRDSFKQLMAPVAIEGTVVPANPYDARQMVDHLSAHSSEARALIWTLNLELTPIYAIEPVGPYAAEVYQLMSTLLSGEVASEENDEFIERVSIPGRLTDRTVKLFSGQALPVVEVEQVRGLYGWRINTLIGAATEAARGLPEPPPEEQLRGSLREFLTRVYYDLRNLGSTSRDRALNFAATNAFQAAHTFASAVAGGMALDTIGVEKSPFCRMDSDCWDVKLRFFDPENSRRARKVFRFTIDVSDLMPVTLGVVRTWSEAS